LFVH